jgi:hypothetical protein
MKGPGFDPQYQGEKTKQTLFLLDDAVVILKTPQINVNEI